MIGNITWEHIMETRDLFKLSNTSLLYYKDIIRQSQTPKLTRNKPNHCTNHLEIFHTDFKKNENLVA
jgi:hypothetical protein